MEPGETGCDRAGPLQSSSIATAMKRILATFSEPDSRKAQIAVELLAGGTMAVVMRWLMV